MSIAYDHLFRVILEKTEKTSGNQLIQSEIYLVDNITHSILKTSARGARESLANQDLRIKNGCNYIIIQL